MVNRVILSIEDDRNQQAVLAQYLRDEGYDFVSASDVEIALQKIQDINVDVILLGFSAAEGDVIAGTGHNAVTQIRSHSNVGLIVTSPRGDLAEKIICLESGADDYISGPLEPREIAAMIRALIRRCAQCRNESAVSQGPDARAIHFNGWCLRTDRHQLRDRSHHIVELTPGEYKILRAFVTSPGRIINRTELVEIVQGQIQKTQIRSADMLVARLRRKLGQDGVLIRTIRGSGYIFDGRCDVRQGGTF